MNILFVLIPLALLLGFGFLVAFLWANSKGQFDDLSTPAMRILNEEIKKERKP